MHLIQIMISSNFYMFRHRSAIFRESTDTYHKSNTPVCRTCDTYVRRPPGDGTPVPKYVDVATYHDVFY